MTRPDLDAIRAATFQCRCIWDGERCNQRATQEDGLCDWCAPFGSRTEAQQRSGTKAVLTSDGKFWGVSGAGQNHDHLGADGTRACWYPESQRSLA